MTPQQAREVASLLTSSYPHVAGKDSVTNAYARVLAPFPYTFVGEVIARMIETREDAFCPTPNEVLDAMVERYQQRVSEEVGNLARAEYAARYTQTTPGHEVGFVMEYARRAGLWDISRDDALKALRQSVRPVEYVELHSMCKLRPIGQKD